VDTRSPIASCTVNARVLSGVRNREREARSACAALATPRGLSDTLRRRVESLAQGQTNPYARSHSAAGIDEDQDKRPC